MNFIKSKSTNQNISTVATVNQLTSFDMIYVYHLLSLGTKLKLIQNAIKLNGEIEYTVMFKNFKLGFITLSNISKMLFSGEAELNASVFKLAKEKYLPIKSLDIRIHQKNLKMVS